MEARHPYGDLVPRRFFLATGSADCFGLLVPISRPWPASTGQRCLRLILEVCIGEVRTVPLALHGRRRSGVSRGHPRKGRATDSGGRRGFMKGVAARPSTVMTVFPKLRWRAPSTQFHQATCWERHFLRSRIRGSHLDGHARSARARSGIFTASSSSSVLATLLGFFHLLSQRPPCRF